ncbi:MAG: FkbM family methyltransferase [Chthoniobacter sp.]|nr:FkbM family methyltransferase [Chthoniobacter sp.]
MSYFESKILKLWQFFFCLRNYGWRNALLMTVRVGSTQSSRTLLFRTSLPGRKVNFTFRGKTDLGVLSHFYKEGFYIQDTSDLPIRTILDCGANIGDETARFRMHYPDAEIIAVEADPDNAEVLKKSFAPDPLTTVVEGAVWHEDTELTLCKHEGGNPEASSVTAESQQGIKVRALSIPSLMKQRGWSQIDILKLDIEGAEYDLFKTNTQWLNSVQSLVFEVPDSERPGTLQLIFERLRESAWTGVAIGECLVLIRRELPWKAEQVIGIKSTAKPR